MAKKDSYIVGIDIGSTKTCALIGEISGDGPAESPAKINGGSANEGIEFLGVGVADSKGIRRGVIVNLDAAKAALVRAIELAEDTAGEAASVEPRHLGALGALHDMTIGENEPIRR